MNMPEESTHVTKEGFKRVRREEALEHLKSHLRSVFVDEDIDLSSQVFFEFGSMSRGERFRQRKKNDKSANDIQDWDIVMVEPHGVEERRIRELEYDLGERLAEFGVDFSFVKPTDVDRVGSVYTIKDINDVVRPLNLEFKDE